MPQGFLRTQQLRFGLKKSWTDPINMPLLDGQRHSHSWWELTRLLVTDTLSFKWRPKATGCTQSASYNTQPKESPFFKRAPVHSSQPMKDSEGKRDSSVLTGCTKPRSLLSPKYTKGSFQVQATKQKGRCESGAGKGT